MKHKDEPEHELNMTFMQYMGDNYYNIKNKLQLLCNGFNDVLFDEDIFHDTIIKVDTAIDTKRFDKSVYEKYMCKSFRTNLVRDKLYHRNSMTDHPESWDGIEPYTLPYVEHTIDFGYVIKILNKSFGVTLTKAYIDWLSGYTVKEIANNYDLDSGYYYITKMTNFIREYHKKDFMIY